MNPANAKAFVAAIVLSGIGFVLVPVLVGRLRAQHKLKQLGLSASEIAWVRRTTRALRAELGGRPREEACAALVAVLLNAGEDGRTP